MRRKLGLIVVGLAAVAFVVAQEKKDDKKDAAKPQTQEKKTDGEKKPDAKDGAEKKSDTKDGKEKGVTAANAKSVLDFTMKDIDGKDMPLSKYKGNVLLVVNVASKCGLTPQYEQLEALNKKYKDRGLKILGFPANNFGGQEPGTESEIKTFCTSKYNVTFDMFSKISVKGDDQHELYKFLTSKEKDEKFAGEIQWNFTKFLVDRDGKVIARFEPKTKPDEADVVKAIEAALGEKK